MHWLANFNDYEIKTVKATIEVNEKQKLKLLKKAIKYHDDFYGLEVAILGVTFKTGTDDLLEASSLTNIPILIEAGAKIRAWDPVGTEQFKNKGPDHITYCQTIEETIHQADICFIFNEWLEIRNFVLFMNQLVGKRLTVILFVACKLSQK